MAADQQGRARTTPVKRVILSSLLLVLFPAEALAGNAQPLADPFGPPAVPMTGSVAEYAAAMLAMSKDIRETRPTEVHSLFVPRTGIPFLWRADDGSTLQRVESGVFRITKGDCVSRMCTDLLCFAQAWPTFVCEDDKARTMTATDPTTVVFDKATFKRVNNVATLGLRLVSPN